MKATPLGKASSDRHQARDGATAEREYVPLNVYHCCVHKSGSQWLRAMLADERILAATGLVHHTYQKQLPGGFDGRKLLDRTFEQGFPVGTILSPLYVEYRNFAAMPKPERYRGFFVMRDPRDVVVSWYFSRKYSHVVTERAKQLKKDVLHDMSLEEGMLYSIDYLAQYGIYTVLDSWIGASERDPNLLVVRFEDLVGPRSRETFERVFAHCAIELGPGTVGQLLDDYSFERLSGRGRGEEDRSAHYRKGVPGDWRTYFDDKMTRRFQELTGDLVVRLGYGQGGREGAETGVGHGDHPTTA